MTARNALHKADRFNSQSEAEAINKYQPQPAATRRRAKLWAAGGFFATERSVALAERREVAKKTE